MSRPQVTGNDHATGPHQQTLGEAIVAAHKAVEEAEAERARLIRFALDRGASTRGVAVLLPVNHSTVFRWAGGRQGPTAALDQPLLTAEALRRMEGAL